MAAWSAGFHPNTIKGAAMPEMSPQAEYEQRHQAAKEQVGRFDSLDARLADARLGVFVLLLLWLLAAWWWIALPWWSAALPAGGFVGLLVVHDRVLRARKRAEGLRGYYADGLRRMDGTWPGTGQPGGDFAPEGHPYAQDLDLFGAGSLFELLCTARTRVGQETLAAWLCAPAQAAEVIARQEAVRELRERLALREDLALLGQDVGAAVHPRSLERWADAPPEFQGRGLRIAATALAGASALSVLAGILLGTVAPPLLMLAVAVGFFMLYLKRLKRISAALEEPARELALLARVLERFEAEQFSCALLKGLQQRLRSEDRTASDTLRRLDRLMYLFELQSNQVFAPVALMLAWGVHCGYALEDWRMRWGSQAGRWLSAVGELEALCALSAYAYEHPSQPFPVLEEGPPAYTAEQLAHPLLPPDQRVANDVTLGDGCRVLVVSGSNMSGKSTLLRSVGANAVLALMGAPVCARSLKLRPVSIGATMRVQDSIQSGTSRFYAEIKRLKQMMDLTEGPHPLLFLMDEILHGTNSHDRSLGAAALVRRFLEKGAIGLLTTHDLAITAMVEQLEGRAANVHFEDHYEAGELRFDYTLREGVVRKSNALQLMRGIGLDV